jgi:hypothetical protein
MKKTAVVIVALAITVGTAPNAGAEEYYKYCEIAHIYGVTPIPARADGYGAWLDDDHDGVACEPGEGLGPEGYTP